MSKQRMTLPFTPPVVEIPNRAEVQGNILRGYKLPRCRSLVVEVTDPAAVRAWLRDAATVDRDGPTISNDADRDQGTKPTWRLNVGVTAEGLRRLGVPESSMRTFPKEFLDGAVKRAGKVGDWGDSAPGTWMHHLGDPSLVHLVVMVHGLTSEDVDRVAHEVQDTPGLRVLAGIDAAQFDGAKVHFGYRDSIAQPRLAGIHDADVGPDDQPATSVGAVLLGYPSSFEGLTWRVPTPEVLGRNGAFDAFRVLEQDVKAFEGYLDYGAGEVRTVDPGISFGDARELVAAKMMGRWRDGTPLETSPDAPGGARPDTPNAALDRFDYDQDDIGERCPIGSHIRRANPRSAHIVQRNASHVRRLVRRGMPYGPAFEPDNPDDGFARGLVGNFLCSSLVAQFEAVMYDWVNLGLLDPRITGLNDPVIGQNEPSTGRFCFWHEGHEIELWNLPRFVKTRGAAYLFLPSLPALRWIGELQA